MSSITSIIKRICTYGEVLRYWLDKLSTFEYLFKVPTSSFAIIILYEQTDLLQVTFCHRGTKIHQKGPRKVIFSSKRASQRGIMDKLAVKTAGAFFIEIKD